MNRDLKNIDKLFHQNLSGAGEQPPVHIWDGIENALDIADAKRIADKRNKRKRLVYAALFIVAVGMAGVVWKANQTGDSVVVAKTNLVLPLENRSSVQENTSTVLSGNKTPEAILPLEENEAVGKPVASSMVSRSAINNQKKADRFINNDQTVAQQVQPAIATVDVVPSTGKKIDEDLENTGAHNTVAQVNYVVTSPGETININRVSQRFNTPGTLPLGHSSAVSKNSAPMVRVKKPGKFSLTVFFAPDITTRNLEQNFGNTRDEGKEELMRTERNSEFDFTLGARVEYKLGKHFSLQSGLSFSTNTIDITQKTIFARFDNRDGSLKYRFNFSSGYAYFKPKTFAAPQFLGDSAQALSSTSTLHYINLPLAVKYYMPLGKRFNFSVQAGITARFITKQNIDAVYASNGANEKGRTNEIQGLKTTYFNGVVGVGADYSLTSKLALTVFPSFNFATTSINRDAPVKAYPNTLSLAMGMKFNF